MMTASTQAIRVFVKNPLRSYVHEYYDLVCLR